MGDERAAASEAGGTEEVERAIGGLGLTDVKDHAFWQGREMPDKTRHAVAVVSLNPLAAMLAVLVEGGSAA